MVEWGRVGLDGRLTWFALLRWLVDKRGALWATIKAYITGVKFSSHPSTPRATARVPAPHHATPALTKTTKWEVADPYLCKGGGGEDERMGPLRSPWGGALPNAFY